MRGVIIVLMAILGVIFPKFLVKAIKSTDRNDADGGLLGSQITFGMPVSYTHLTLPTTERV